LWVIKDKVPLLHFYMKIEKRLDAVAKTRDIRASIDRQRTVNPLQYFAETEETKELGRRIRN